MPTVVAPTGKHLANPVKSHLRAHPKEKCLKRSEINFRHTGDRARRATITMWAQASKSPLYMQKREQRYDKQGEPIPFPLDKKTNRPITIRSNRALSSNTLKTYASGAAATVYKMVHEEGDKLCCDPPAEEAKYPMLPMFGPGPSMAIEAAWIAYVQEIFGSAIAIMKGMDKHSKVSSKSMQAAADIVNAKISSATGFVPPSVTIRKQRTSTAGCKGVAKPAKSGKKQK
tara:strand:+ start:1193 stop:1879 length:687 start_codon:yes stop_codon:yes gene_type:complete